MNGPFGVEREEGFQKEVRGIFFPTNRFSFPRKREEEMAHRGPEIWGGGALGFGLSESQAK